MGLEAPFRRASEKGRVLAALQQAQAVTPGRGGGTLVQRELAVAI